MVLAAAVSTSAVACVWLARQTVFWLVCFWRRQLKKFAIVTTTLKNITSFTIVDADHNDPAREFGQTLLVPQENRTTNVNPALALLVRISVRASLKASQEFVSD